MNSRIINNKIIYKRGCFFDVDAGLIGTVKNLIFVHIASNVWRASNKTCSVKTKRSLVLYRLRFLTLLSILQIQFFVRTFRGRLPTQSVLRRSVVNKRTVITARLKLCLTSVLRLFSAASVLVHLTHARTYTCTHAAQPAITVSSAYLRHHTATGTCQLVVLVCATVLPPTDASVVIKQRRPTVALTDKRALGHLLETPVTRACRTQQSA